LVCVVGVNLTPFTPLLTPSTPLQLYFCRACPATIRPLRRSRSRSRFALSVSASAVLHVPCCHAPSPTPIRIHKPVRPSLLLPCSTSRVATLRLHANPHPQTRPDQTKPDQTPRRPVSSKQCRPARSCLHRSPLPPTDPACANTVPLPHRPTLQSRLCLSGPSAAPRVRRVRVEL
jgi:hypothetical protein